MADRSQDVIEHLNSFIEVRSYITRRTGQLKRYFKIYKHEREIYIFSRVQSSSRSTRELCAFKAGELGLLLSLLIKFQCSFFLSSPLAIARPLTTQYGIVSSPPPPPIFFIISVPGNTRQEKNVVKEMCFLSLYRCPQCLIVTMFPFRSRSESVLLSFLSPLTHAYKSRKNVAPAFVVVFLIFFLQFSPWLKMKDAQQEITNFPLFRDDTSNLQTAPYTTSFPCQTLLKLHA